MGKDVLVASNYLWGRGIHVGWYLADEQEGGATLGYPPSHRTTPPPEQYKEDNDSWIASYAIAKAFPEVETNEYGFSFDTITQARKALAVGKKAIQDAKLGREPEEWEMKALSEGWRPPRGWVAPTAVKSAGKKKGGT